MRNIFKVHLFFYFTAFICVITGYFKEFIFIALILFIHELGHILGAFIYHWKIKQVLILPFGYLTVFEEKIDKLFKEEIIITILGPIFQIIGYYFLKAYFPLKFRVYHLNLLLLNLVPIFPLDGFKLLSIVIAIFFPYWKSSIIGYFLSFIFIFLLMVYVRNNVLLLFYIINLFIKLLKNYKMNKFYFYKFLLDRIIYGNKFRKIKFVKNKGIYGMYRNCNHYFLENNSYYNELNYLKKFLKKNKS